MSGFSDGVISGLAGGGLANSISKLMMLGPQIEQMRQKGVLNGAQASMYQAKRDSELQNLQLVKAVSDAMREKYGDEYAMVRPTTGADAKNMLAFAQGFNQMAQVNKAFPLQDSRALVQGAVDAAAADPSFSESARATPPISAFGKLKGLNVVQEPERNPAVDNLTLLENLQKNVDWTAKINGAMQGRAQHRAVGNTGYSIDPYLGDSDVSNEDLVRMYTDKANLDIANKQSIIANRGQIMARRAATPIRGSGGGHHKRRGGGRGGRGGTYVEEERHGILGQTNTRNGKWQPYSNAVQEGERRSRRRSSGGGGGGEPSLAESLEIFKRMGIDPRSM